MKHLYLSLLAVLCTFSSFAILPITGNPSVCQGSYTALSNGVPGGTWSSSSVAMATVSSTGVVTGVMTGIPVPVTATITYTLGIDYSTINVTVNPLPAAISGSLNICLGNTSSLTDATAGGTWSSSAPGIATVAAGSGILAGFYPGTAIVSYTLPTGCFTTAMATINPPPSAILGTLVMCSGLSTSLTDGPSGGGWSTSNPAIAVVNSTGLVTGVGASGTATITYTLGTGCYSTAVVTVNPDPPAINGNLQVCVGGTTQLSDLYSPGSWVTSNPAVAIISPTGVVTGIGAPATSVVTYTLPTGCVTTAVLTINPMPTPINGTLSVCPGSTTLLTDATVGGIWTSNNSAIALVDSSTGYIITIAGTTGTTTISYTISSGCYTTKVLTVNPGSSSITGISGICAGTTTNLTDPTPGGTWSSSNTAVGTIDVSGVVAGIATGTTIIGYSLPSGCYATRVVTVNTAPPAITGLTNVCSGSTTSLSDALPGGIWTSSSSGIASIGSISGVATAGTAGTTTISYTIPTGCASTATVTVLICTCSGTPAGGSATTSDTALCYGNGGTVSLTGVTISSAFGYQWQTSTDSATWTDLGGATSASYSFNAATSQYYRCTTTCLSSGLSANSSAVYVRVNNMIGTHYIVSVPDTSCTAAHFYISTCGLSSAYNVTTYFGDGESTNAALTATGLCHADVYHSYVSAGTYSVKQVLYMGTTALDSVTFSYEYLYCHILPLKFYYDANANCTFDAWEVYNTLATSVEVDSNGIAIDTLNATSGLYYKALGPAGTIYGFKVLSLPGGMTGTCAAVVYDTVTSLSTYAPKFMGLNCSGTTTSFDLSVTSSSAASTGRHSQMTNIQVSNSFCTSVAPVVTMIFDAKYSFSSASPAPTSITGNTITWDLSSLSAGSSSLITVWLARSYSLGWLVPGDTVHSTISVSPTIGDANPDNNTITKCDTVKSSWDPNDLEVAPQGYVLPCTPLQYKINFENTGNDTAHNIYVLDTLSDDLDLNSFAIISASATMNTTMLTYSGHNIVKFGFPNINLLDTSHHSNSNGMVIFSVKAKSGLADGEMAGNQAGIYFDDNPVVMTNLVQNTIGIAPITGNNSVCAGAYDTLINTSTGGIWNVTNANATVSGGVLTGAFAGLDTVSYTVSNSCASKSAISIVAVNVIPTPGPIMGALTICRGGTSLLSDTVTTGTWNSDATGIATVSSSGSVTAVSTGTAMISYTVTNGCGTGMIATTVSVAPLPAAGSISGAATMCTGTSVPLSSTASGGLWTSGSAGVATVNSDGLVTGVAGGSVVISYSVTNSCGTDIATFEQTINATPDAGIISGPGTVCADTSVSLASTASGGAWSSASPGIATIGTAGDVTGIVAGVATISYIVTNDCGSNIATYAVTVNPLPSAGFISGDTMLCAGATISLTSTAGGGAWISESPAIASVGSTGDVTGMVAGSAVISYTVTNACGTDVAIYSENVHPIVVPGVGVTPTDTLCEGTMTTFAAAGTGGGAVPVYQWTVNGVDAGSGAYHTYFPTNGDIVTVKMMSSAACAVPDSALQSITVIAEPPVLPVVNITADPGFTVSHGQVDTLTANVLDGGTSPVYEWLVNGIVVPGATSSVYFSTFSDHDSVSCRVVSSGLCGGYTSFNSVSISVNNTGIAPLATIKGLTLYPNPASRELNILWGSQSITSAEITITDVAGREVFRTQLNTVSSGHTTVELPLLLEGMYMVSIKSAEGQYHSKLEISR